MEKPDVIRVLIVAAYASVRAGLHALLAEEFRVVGDVSGSAELERLLPEAGADVVVVDYNTADGRQVLETAAAAEVGVVLLGEERDGFLMITGLPFPGWAYLLKEAEGPEIAAAVRAVAGGLVALDPGVARDLTSACAGANGEAPAAREGEVLTAREREVLQLMAEGLPNKTIAARLNISRHTVKFHVASVLAKLGAASRTEAVTLGARQGFLVL
jgi:DNA-binding NarL/FixJ family response regulator